MSFNASSVGVTNAATLLVNPSTGNVADPVPVAIWNNDSTNTIYIGGSGVTTGNGWPVLKGTGITMRLVASDPVYAIAGVAGPLDVRVLIGRQ